MTYFFDFDRTIFDTDSFKKTLTHRMSLRNIFRQTRNLFVKKKDQVPDPGPRLSREKRFRLAAATYSATGTFGFSPQELRSFLYPEVQKFLEEHGNEIIIVTYGVQAFITAKVASALAGFNVKEIVYTSHRKGKTIKCLCEKYPGPYTYVDDAHFQLVSVSAYCPDITIIEMRRDGRPGDGRWPVVHTLDELPT